jgi:poly(beta-D-mannuronate) lyase
LVKEKNRNIEVLKFRSLIILVFALILFPALYSKSIKVSDVAQYNKAVKTLLAGDSVVLANGIWKDTQLVFKGHGAKEKYIYLTAETPGKVTLEGLSSLKLCGEWLHISGLVFRNGQTPGKTVIEFRTNSNDYAYNCVLTNCVVDSYNQKLKNYTDHWVGIWGKKNTVANCYFGGKTNAGTTLVIWPDDSNCVNNNHLIYRNYFGYRPVLGFNGGESIRIGTSEVCFNSSASIVEGNYFERCNGEGEIISNKSGDNKFLNNTFFECEGTLTLRHGNRAVVSGNWFMGNGKKNTGGVRVINEGHLIYNNFFYKLRGKEIRGALVIMNGIPNSPASGYAAVKNVIVTNNTFADCTSPWIFCYSAGESNCTVKPESTSVVNNIVYCLNDSELIISYDKSGGITLENNLMVNEQGFNKSKGSVAGDVITKRIGGFIIPTVAIKAKSLTFIGNDILGLTGQTTLIGAFQNFEDTPKVELATAENCGPEWYKATITIQKMKN